MESAGWNNRPWILPRPSEDTRRPRYVAIGGNTGSGKSTLVREVGRLLGGDLRNVAIDERDTHHPFLDRLFHDPKSYAFALQLNFMMQRCLLVKRWLDLGMSLVMERSHAEDPIFIRFLLEQKLVSQAQYDTYMSVWDELNLVTPLPDVLAILDVQPEESVRRLLAAEAALERPREFPDEATRALWVGGWHAHYRRRCAELELDESMKDRLLVFRGPADPAAMAKEVLARF